MEKRGYLFGETRRLGRIRRRIYRATPLGEQLLRHAQGKVRELFGELIGGR